MKIIILILSMLVYSASFAQNNQLAERVRKLEQQMYQVQQNVYHLENRVRHLESGGYLPPLPPPSVGYSAILIDTGYAKTFLGVGNTRLQAEANARQECGKVVNAAYCNGAVRIGQAKPGNRGYFCMVTDSGYGKSFSGEGPDEIQAEARAKIACQASVNAAYCGNVTPRCEAIQ